MDTIIHVDILKLTQIREFGSKIEDFSHLDCCAELGVGLFPRRKSHSPSIEGVLGPVTTFVLQEQANLAPKPTQGHPGGYWQALVLYVAAKLAGRAPPVAEIPDFSDLEVWDTVDIAE